MWLTSGCMKCGMRRAWRLSWFAEWVSSGRSESVGQLVGQLFSQSVSQSVGQLLTHSHIKRMKQYTSLLCVHTKWSKPALTRIFSAVGCHSMYPTRRLWPFRSMSHSDRWVVSPSSGIYHSLTWNNYIQHVTQVSHFPSEITEF